MNQESAYYCPNCDDGSEFVFSPSRRQFVRALGLGAAALTSLGKLDSFAQEASAKAPKPAEDMIRELFASLSPEQKGKLVFPWDHQGPNGISRLGTYNSPFNGMRIGAEYSKDQQQLVRRILESVLSGNESFERISRNGRWDSSGSLEGCGATIFGDPTGGKPFAWLFSGHHLTLRCDGNSLPNAAFGGPIYYGHSVGGYSDKNVYYYQTAQVQSVFEALDPAQRKQAVALNNPGDGLKGVRFPENPKAERPGIAYRDLNAEQKKLVESVMRTLLDPFRPEDSAEAMEIVKASGGMEEVHLAFYQDKESQGDKVRWDFWRLEGPGLIWNYRVLPHVHCFVNIATAAA